MGNPSSQNRGNNTTVDNVQPDFGPTNLSQGTPDFYFIHQTQQNVKLSQSVFLRKQQIDERKIQRVQVQFKSYIPAAFHHSALIKDVRQLMANGSHLKQTVLAMAIELNQESLDCASKHQLHLLQSVVQIIQL